MSWLVLSRQAVRSGGLGIPGLVEGQPQLLELLPRQVARPLGHDEQGGDEVQVVLQELGEAAQIVVGRWRPSP